MKTLSILFILFILTLPSVTNSQSLYLDNNNGFGITGTFNRLQKGDGFSIKSGFIHNGKLDFGFSYQYQEQVFYEMKYWLNENNYEKITASYHTTTIETYISVIPIKFERFSFAVGGRLQNISRGFISQGKMKFIGGLTTATKIDFDQRAKFIPHLSWVNEINVSEKYAPVNYFTYGMSFSYKKHNRNMIFVDITLGRGKNAIKSFSFGYIFNLGYKGRHL